MEGQVILLLSYYTFNDAWIAICGAKKQASYCVKSISQKWRKLAEILYRLSIYNSKNWLYYK